MPVMTLLGRHVMGSDGPVRVVAVYAGLPPELRDDAGDGDTYAEVVGPDGDRWKAIVAGDRAELLEQVA